VVGFVRCLFAATMVSALGLAALAAQQSDPVRGTSAQFNTSDPKSITAGKELFQTNCALCHGEEGKGRDRGSEHLPVTPDLTDDTWLHGGTDIAIYSVIKNGVGPKFVMEPWEGRIPDEGIRDLVSYIRSLHRK